MNWERNEEYAVEQEMNCNYFYVCVCVWGAAWRVWERVHSADGYRTLWAISISRSRAVPRDRDSLLCIVFVHELKAPGKQQSDDSKMSRLEDARKTKQEDERKCGKNESY